MVTPTPKSRPRNATHESHGPDIVKAVVLKQLEKVEAGRLVALGVGRESVRAHEPMVTA